jgi:hypothetical protein
MAKNIEGSVFLDFVAGIRGVWPTAAGTKCLPLPDSWLRSQLRRHQPTIGPIRVQSANLSQRPYLKILVKRTDAYAGTLGDCVGGANLKTMPLQNASSRFEYRIHRLGSTRLSWQFTWLQTLMA